MSEPSRGGSRPQKSKAPTPSQSPSSKSKSKSSKSKAKSSKAKSSQAAPSKSKSRQKQSRRRAKTPRKPRARRRGERRSRVRLRQVIPGATHFITRKTNDDQFLLRPDDAVDRALLYLLIEKINKYGFLLHEFVVMGSHFHIVVTDVFGQLPAFMREFLSETGKALKVVLGTTRRIWSGDRYSATNLLDLDAAERFMVYTRMNPMEAGLTEPGDWPGLTSARWKYGDTIEAVRPDEYFDAKRRPERVSLVLAPLPEPFGKAVEEARAAALVEGADDSEVGVEDNEATQTKERAKERAKERRRCAALQKRIDQRTAEAVREIREKMKRESDPKLRKLAGASHVVNVSRTKRGSHPYGRLNPRFATKDRERLLAAIEAEKIFRARHEEARLRYLGGEQGVLFPAGTYGYRELWGVRVRKGGAAA